MSAAELKIVIELLCGIVAGEGTPSWAERRAGMEASLAPFPVPPEIETKPVNANGVPAEWQWRSGAREDAAILYVHGGGYAAGSINTHRPLTAVIAQSFAGRVLSVDYRLAPEHPCPAAIDDAVAAYRFLLDQGVKHVVIAGDSAGGGLTLATLIALRDADLPKPAGGWCISPWVDLTATSATMASKAETDVIVSAKSLGEYAAAYAPGGNLRDVRATPLHADLAGLPPLLIQVGTAETLLDDSTSLAARAAAADVDVRLEAWPGMPHVWHIFNAMLGEGREAIASGTAWANGKIGG